jgi:hypothetical protein
MTLLPAASKRSPLRGASVGPFPLITLVFVIAIGLAAFLAATYLETFGDGGGEPRTTGANSFSRSAIGHRAFVQALRNLDIPVQVSRFRSLDKAGTGSLLLVIEPDFDPATDGLLKSLHRAPHALLVLPKWDGATDRKKPIWIDRMKLLPESTPSSVLRAVAGDATLMRDAGTATIEAPRFGGRIALTDPQYILGGSDMRIEPILSSSGKILLGAMNVGHSQLWILSDPDLLSNSGIDEANNGVVAVSIIDALLPKGGSVIVDETLHGYEQRPNLMRTLLHPPFVTILIAAIVAMLVLVWAGATRFGAPQPETDGLAAGKLTLVKSAAKLLRFGTSAGNLLLSYRRMVLADAMGELHAPNGLDEAAQAAWLDRAAEHRGLDVRLRPLLDRMSALAESGRIDATRALRFAHELYRWKQEILHGTVILPRGRRSAGNGVGPSGVGPSAVGPGGVHADGTQGGR